MRTFDTNHKPLPGQRVFMLINPRERGVVRRCGRDTAGVYVSVLWDAVIPGSAQRIEKVHPAALGADTTVPE